jgi:hypothetical protein
MEFAIDFDMRALMLSVLCFTYLAFLVATLLALKLCRQPLGLRSATCWPTPPAWQAITSPMEVNHE